MQLLSFEETKSIETIFALSLTNLVETMRFWVDFLDCKCLIYFEMEMQSLQCKNLKCNLQVQISLVANNIHMNRQCLLILNQVDYLGSIKVFYYVRKELIQKFGNSLISLLDFLTLNNFCFSLYGLTTFQIFFYCRRMFSHTVFKSSTQKCLFFVFTFIFHCPIFEEKFPKEFGKFLFTVQ